MDPQRINKLESKVTFYEDGNLRAEGHPDLRWQSDGKVGIYVGETSIVFDDVTDLRDALGRITQSSPL